MNLHQRETKEIEKRNKLTASTKKTTHKKRELKANDKCQGEAWSLLDYLFCRGEKEAGDQSVSN